MKRTREADSLTGRAVTNHQSRAAIHAWLFLLPAMVLLLSFTHLPTVATLVDSFFSTPKGSRPAVWVGIENYRTMAEDPVFWKSVTNNLWFAGATIPLSIGLALAMALWVNERITGRAFLRMAYFTPTVLPMIAAANLWLFFYTPGLGVLDQIGSLFGLPSVNWLGQPETALWAIIIVTIWKEAGFFMIFYLAALQTIPEDLKEAADIEGTSRWTYTRRIVLPLLMPTTLFIAVNAMINSVKLIDHLFILTKGGPSDASKLILYYIWEMAFAFFDAPHAAAMTILVIAVLGIVAAVQFLYLDKRTHYQ